MASLANVSPGSSYPGLLKTENNTGVTGSLQTITDGEGTVLPLRLSCDYITNYGNGEVTSNTVFGQNALSANTTGSGISAFGNNALKCNTTGFANTAFGDCALLFNTTGLTNHAIGYRSLTSLVEGSGNTASGYSSLATLVSGSCNTAFGRSTGGGIVTGNSNVGIGFRTQRIGCACNFNNNTAIGFCSQDTLFSGASGNTTIGSESARIISGCSNTGLGASVFAGPINLSGCGNIAIGNVTARRMSTGSDNIYLGNLSGCSLSAGVQNSNIAIGNCSLMNASGSCNIALGGSVDSGSFSNSILIGSCATATANNQFVVGATGAFNAGAITVESVSPTHTWQVRINGQNYKIPLIPV